MPSLNRFPQASFTPSQVKTLQALGIKILEVGKGRPPSLWWKMVQAAMPFLSPGESQALQMAATQAAQETQMSFNMQYLQLQNSMQSNNRQYTMVSNIMKTKHDTVKNTISNIH